MKILYVSQYFPPEMGAPAARVFELSREWARLGHQVTVLTGFPNHPTGVVPAEYRGQWLRRESIEGVEVVRAPIYAAANRGLVRRSLNYASFSLSAAAVGPWVTDRPDVLIATSPQFLVAAAGLWLARLKRVPFVFEVRDLWPQSIVEVGAMRADSPVIRALEGVERLLYRHADRIVVVTHAFIEALTRRGVPRERLEVVTNGVDLELFRPAARAQARAELGLPEGFLATYVGTHGMSHGLDLLLDAAKQLRTSGIRLLLVGEGAEKQRLAARGAAEGIDNVLFWSQQPRERVARVLAASDLCLVLLRDLPLFRAVIPSKIFEFMGSGRPILTTVDGESRAIIEAAGAGVFSPPGDLPSLVATLQRLAADEPTLHAMGAAGRRHVESHYSRAALALRYAELLERVADTGP